MDYGIGTVDSWIMTVVLRINESTLRDPPKRIAHARYLCYFISKYFWEGSCLMLETSVILRAILLQVKKAKSIKEIEKAIEAMCQKEDIDAVNQSFRELLEDE